MKKTLLFISFIISTQFNALSQDTRGLYGYTITAGQTTGENITYKDLIPDSTILMDWGSNYKDLVLM